jgi:hypothetical protein
MRSPLSIAESGMPLVDLTRDDGEASPSGAAKEEPADPRGKQNVATDDDYKLFQYYNRFRRRC